MERLKLYFAQLDVSPLPGSDNPDEAATLSDLQTMFGIAFAIAGLVAVLIVVYGGVRFIASRGNASETVKARNTILYGLVGLAVVLLATAIVSFTIGI